MTAWMAAAPELVEGLTGLVAVVLMLAVGGWLHGKTIMKNWNLWLKQKMDRSADSPWALGALAFLAVLREGAETVVFLWGMAGPLPMADLLIGMAGGLAVLSLLGVLMLRFSRRLPLRWFFPLATILIYFLAVKILGQSLGALQAAGWLAGTYLGFGGPIAWLGFSPTWETAAPQFALVLILGTLVFLSLRKGIGNPGAGGR
jgi:high-affinity iron transporter